MSFSDIRYVGVNDYELDLFEGQYPLPRGMAYNSYVIVDEHPAVMDSVEIRFAEEWLGSIRRVLEGRSPEYLIVQHMEPDHSGSILRFMEAWPEATLVASARAFEMMKNFFGEDLTERRRIVGEGDRLSLGRHELQFISAAMIHWPEVIMTYDHTSATLFSADAFGRFGTPEDGEEWAPEARRYYVGIVAKFGSAVQTLLKKLAFLRIDAICSLHGPVLTENIPYYIGLYKTWAAYEAEEKGVLIAYASIYGNTRQAAELLAERLRERGEKVILHDLARCDMFEAVADAFRFDRLVLAATTYNGKVFPFMHSFIHHLVSRNFRGRTVAFMENGSWAPMAAQQMKAQLAECKELRYTEGSVRILSALSRENLAQIRDLADELCP